MTSSSERLPSTQRTRLHRGLLIYYGVLQTAHLIGLAIDALNWQSGAGFLLLAPTPSGGWSTQAADFLLALGAADFGLILLSYVFLLGIWRGKSWGDSLGLACLLAFALTAFVFAAGTVPSGGWAEHPNYRIESLLFAPVLLLLALQARWTLGGRQRQNAGPAMPR